MRNDEQARAPSASLKSKKIFYGFLAAFLFLFFFGWAPGVIIPGGTVLRLYGTFVAVVCVAAPVGLAVIPGRNIERGARIGIMFGTLMFQILFYEIFGQMGYLNLAGLFKPLICPAGFQDLLRIEVSAVPHNIVVDYFGRGPLGEMKLNPFIVGLVTAVLLLLYTALVAAVGSGAALLRSKIPSRGATQKKLAAVLVPAGVFSLFFLVGFLFLQHENSPAGLIMPLFNKALYPGQTTSLIEAVRRGRLDLAEKLMAEGADILGRNARGESPVGLAERIGNRRAVALFIRELSRAHPEVESLYARGILFTEENFIRAIENDNREAVALFLKSGIRLRPSGGADDYCPLRQAINRDFVETAELLMDNGARLDGCPGHEYYLMGAVKNSRERMFEFLLRKGIDINRTDSEGRSALMFAAQDGNVRFVTLCLERGADPHVKNKNDENAALLAGMNLHRSPLKKEANPYFQIIRLLGEKGVDLDVQNKQGWTLIMYGASAGHVSLVKYLLDKKVNINLYLFQPRPEGNNALQMARKQGRAEIVNLLIGAGAWE